MFSSKGLRLKLIVLLGLVLSVSFAFRNTNDVFASQASTIYSEVNSKGRFQGIFKCYKEKAKGKYVINSKIELSEYAGMNSLMYRPLGISTAGPGSKVNMPLAKTESMNCEALLNKYKSKAPASSAGKEKKEEFLTGMGYTMDEKGQSGKCYYLSFKYNGKKKTSNRVCDDGGRVKIMGEANYQQAGFWWQSGGNDTNGTICLTMLNKKGGSPNLNSSCHDLANSGKLKAKSLINKLLTNYSGCSGKTCTIGKNKITDLSTNGPEASSSGVVAKIKGREAAGKAAVATLSDKKQTKKSIAISPLEKRLLYQSYLKSYYGVSIVCSSGDYMEGEIQWYKWKDGGNKTQKCWYKTAGAHPEKKKVHAVNKNGWFSGEIDMQGLISALQKSEKFSDDEVKKMQDVLKKPPEEPDKGGGEENECQKQSGAMGWVFCPVIEKVSEALYYIYDEVVQPFLVINPQYFEGTDGGTYTAWEIFRNFANIAFVIMFLVVIFSQLTGIGIDNYGIKRILPKLIVVAILINLSYIICEVLIDVSNILGSSLSQLFSGIAAQVDARATSPAAYFGGLVNTVITAVGIAATGAAATFAVLTVASNGWSVIAPILLGLLSVLIAVLFMFAVLFIRKAAAILLVAVAPLAFASYVLPNGKKAIFDKWAGIFKGVLLMYPIAGLLIGGGLLASSIIIGAVGNEAAKGGEAGLGEFFLYLGGLLLQVVPFFFLPKVFRESLNAVGSLGDKIIGRGKTFSGGVDKRIREGEGFKRMQARLAAGRTGGFRQRIVSKMPGVLGRNAMARNIMSYNKMLSDQGSYDAAFGKDYMLKTETDNEMKRLVASGEINDINALQRGLEGALQSGKPSDRAKIRAYTDALSAKGDSGRKAVKTAFDNSVAVGKMNDESARTFADNIMANHAVDYKNNNRSMFEVAKGINSADDKSIGSKIQTTGNYMGAGENRANLQMKASADTLSRMDDDAFSETFMRNGSVDISGLADDEKRSLGQAAYNALQNSENMKAERVQQLQDIYKNSGYTPAAQTVEIKGGSTSSNGGGASSYGGAAREGEPFRVQPQDNSVNNPDEYIDYEMGK